MHKILHVFSVLTVSSILFTHSFFVFANSVLCQISVKDGQICILEDGMSALQHTLMISDISCMHETEKIYQNIMHMQLLVVSMVTVPLDIRRKCTV